MIKLYDISGMDYNYGVKDNCMWEGKILLEDDGWFEGIVVDTNSSYTENRFIFGIYYPNKVIELYKITSIDISSPLVFHLNNSVNGYEGQIEMIDLFDVIPCGFSCINTSDSFVLEENLELEILKLQSKIKNYKEAIIDYDGKSFYDNLLRMRNSLIQTILDKYESSKIYSKVVKERTLKINNK